MRHELVGYIVGALDEEDHQDLETHLASNEQLRRELHLMRRAVEPLDADRQHVESPPALARRTCEYVASCRNAVRAPAAAAPARADQFAHFFEDAAAPSTRS